MGDPRQYVVIGGGVAGLASAVWLAEAGKKVTLLERRGRLGGRAHAMKDDAGQEPPANGQHGTPQRDQNLLPVLHRVRTREHVAFPERSTLRWPDGRSVTMSVTGLGAIRTLTGLHPDTGLLDRLRTLRATGLLLWQALNQPHDLADLTTAQWFERIGMPARSREALWDWLALGIAAEPVEIESAKVVADVLATGFRLGAKHLTPVSIGYPTTDLDTLYVDGALRVFREHGVQVHYRAVARRIHIVDGTVIGVVMADGSVVLADAVICAVPNTNIGGLLDDLPEHS